MNCTSCNAELAGDSRFCRVCGLNLSSPGGGPPTTNSGTMLKARLSQILEGRYRVTKMVGRGGMGAVFLAEDLALERPVAIKVLPPEVSHDTKLVGRFEREARTAAKLDHPNIIPIYAVEHSDDLYYFVMKFVAGESLDDVFKRGRVTMQLTQDYLWEAARALGHAHRRGVVHRDIKPANIMLDHDGRVMLTDFGISKAMQSATQYTGTGQVIGTPHYMSPEQAKGGDIDGRSDQYALAVVGYQMVTGRLPFADESIHAVIYKHVSEDPPLIHDLNPDCPPFIATALHRAMHKKPDDRFSDMEAFAQAICPDRRLSVPTTADPGGVIQRSSVSSAPTEVSHTTAVTGAATRRRPLKVASLVIVLLALGGGGYWSWSSGLLDRFGLAGPEAMASVPQAANRLGAQPLAERSGGSTTLASIIDSASLVSSDPSDGLALSESTNTAPRMPQEEQENPPVQRRRQTQPPPTQVATQPPPDPVGWITVRADPWGNLYINDEFVKATTVVEHELPVGTYEVKVERDKCETKVDTVRIRQNDRIIRDYTLECRGSS